MTTGPLVIVLGLLVSLVASFAPAQAAPVYEITGAWADAPADVASGDPVVADWRVNVNDDQPAPSNDTVDDVTATFTLVNSRFDGLPDMCRTAGVTPASSISTDGMTLTCNLGTVTMGTSIALQTPTIADGPTGSTMSARGQIAGAQAPLPEIPIVNPFGMDIRWGTPSAYQDVGDGFRDMDFQWTLSVNRGSEPGPQTIVYDLTIASAQASTITVGPQECTPYTHDPANGHPWSGGPYPADQMASFVGSCELVQTSATTFRLTLSGIDYDPAAPPTRDSTGAPLPTDQVAVASGSVWIRLVPSEGSGGVQLASDAPTYTSASGLQTAPDDPANNTSSKTWVGPGIYSSGWGRGYTGSGGNTWDDTYRVAAGTTIGQYTDTGLQLHPDRADDRPVGMCAALDVRHVTYAAFGWGAPGPGGIEGAVVEYYTGADPTLDPASASYDPNAFSCGGPGGWSTTPPGDPALVKAVRMTVTQGEIEAYSDHPHLGFAVFQTIKPETPAGTDVWSFFSGIVDHADGTSGWWNGTPCITPTAGRYPCTTGFRDIVRIITAVPSITKSAADATVTPGVPTAFTLTYSANGAGSVPATVDGYQIVDTLPSGMTYEPGSADPAPVVGIDGEGRQTLTWTLDGVPTNTANTLTYDAVVDSSVDPGTTLTNTAVASVGGQSTLPAAATVTTSTNGYTSILKTEDMTYIPNPDGSGNGAGSWTVAIASFDPLPQAYTDTIDILPSIGDQRGTAYNGTYELDAVVLPDGGTVYYTDADPATLSDDPAHPSNGAANAPSALWSTTRPAAVTAIRVLGPTLPPGGTFSFQVLIRTEGALGGDVYVNRAQARAEHTALVMRTSAPLIVANHYAATLRKEVQTADGGWIDADVAADHPAFELGDGVTYRIIVTNTGQGTLTNIDVDDDRFPGGSFSIDELGPDESASHEFTVTADDAMLGTFVNTACATVRDTPPDAPAPPEIACDPAGILVSATELTKTLLGKVPNGDGTYTVTYDMAVTRRGDGPGYTLTDTLRYGDSATIEATTVESSDPGAIDTNDGWDGTADTAVTTAVVPIADGETHTYRATVVAAIDEPATTPAMSDCAMGTGEAGTGFTNTATLTSGDDTFEATACVEYPAPVITKAITTGPEPIGDSGYRLTYTVTVANHGVDPTVYELDDELTYGEGIELDAVAVANTAPGGVPTSATWDGVLDTRVATDVPLPGEAVHTYTATVELTSPNEISADAADCSLAGTEVGTGLLNTATLAHNGEDRDAEACAPAPVTTFDKTLVSATPNEDGTTTITYELTVGRTGSGAPYTLTDTLAYGAGATVASAAVTGSSPEGLAINAAWDGARDTTVAADVPIADGETHTYVVVVRATVDETAVPAGAADCTIASGEDGTGFRNTAAVTTNDVALEDQDCEPFPAIEVDKAIASGPTPVGGGRQQVTYRITVTNRGEAGAYDLTDTLTYGGGVTVVGTSVASTSPGGITTNAGWNGGSDTAVVTDQPIGAGGIHVYTATVTVTVAGGITAAQADCTLAGGETGTGLLNGVEVDSNGEVDADDACAALSAGAATPPSSGWLPRTGGDAALVAQLAVALLAAGALAVLVSRRRHRQAAG